MSHDQQDKKYVESRSKLGSASFGEIKTWFGIDDDEDEDMEHESGTGKVPGSKSK